MAIARIRVAEVARYALIDELVDDALAEPGAQTWSGALCDRWKKLSPETFTVRSSVRRWVWGWLVAAEERGELVSELKFGSGIGNWSRRFFRRPDGYGGGGADGTSGAVQTA